MAQSVQFEIGRAQSSRAAQKVTGAASIGGVSLQDWNERVLFTRDKVKAEAPPRFDLIGAAAIWDIHLRDIYDITRHTVVLSKQQLQKEPAKLEMFASIKPSDSNRALIYQNGSDLAAAWQKADPAWVPMEGATLPRLTGLLTQCAEIDEPDHQEKLALWRTAASEVAAAGAALHKDNVAWYAAALRQFPAGTSFGDMIRSTVPVTTETVEEVGQAVIKNLLVTGTTARFDAEAPHATTMTFLQLKPGETEWTTLQADSPETSMTVGGLTPGEHRFKAMGANSQSIGAESAEAVVTVADPKAEPEKSVA